MMTTYDQSTVIYDETGLTYEGLSTFDGIGFGVEIAFGYAPLDTSPDWISVTHLVRGFSTSRGTSSEYASFSPGTATIRLDNRSRVFDPTYTSGPYHGQLNPMTPVRVTASYNGTTHALFTGFVQGWPTTYQTENVDAVTSLPCVDATQILGSSVLPVKYEKIVSEDTDLALYFPLQEQEDKTTTVTNAYGTFTNTHKVTYDSARQYSFTIDGSSRDGEFFDEIAPVQPGKSYQHYVTNIGLVDLDLEGTSFLPGLLPLFDAPLKAFEIWLYYVDADRFDSTGRESLFTALYDSGTINRETRVSMSLNDDGTLYGLSYYTDTVGHTETAIGGSINLIPGAANHIVLTANETNVQVYVNNVLQYDEPFNDTYQTYGGSGTYTRYQVWAYATRVAHAAAYYETFDAAKVAERYNAGYGYIGDRTDERLTRTLDDAGWPAVWRDLQTGVQTVGAYRAAGVEPSTYMQEINVAEQGNVFINRVGHVEMLNRDTVESVNIVTSFDDSSIDLPFTDVVVDANNISAIANKVTASYRFGSVERENAASISAYGIRNKSVSVALIDDADEAASIADAIIDRQKDPRTIIKSLNVNVRSDPSVLAPVVSSLELGDNIVVSFTPTNVGDPLWRVVTVQGISHSVTPTGWNVNMYLVPSSMSTNGPLVVLNDDTYGELNAGNRLG